MRLFVGLDVTLTETALCVVSENGKIVKEAEVASEPEPLLAWLHALEGSIAAIGLEARPLSQWLHCRLTDAGLDAVLMKTRQRSRDNRRRAGAETKAPLWRIIQFKQNVLTGGKPVTEVLSLTIRGSHWITAFKDTKHSIALKNVR